MWKNPMHRRCMILTSFNIWEIALSIYDLVFSETNIVISNSVCMKIVSLVQIDSKTKFQTFCITLGLDTWGLVGVPDNLALYQEVFPTFTVFCTTHAHLMLDFSTDGHLFFVNSRQICPCWSQRNHTKSQKKGQRSPLKLLGPA